MRVVFVGKTSPFIEIFATVDNRTPLLHFVFNRDSLRYFKPAKAFSPFSEDLVDESSSLLGKNSASSDFPFPLIIGRDTMNSTSSKLRVNEPSKDTSNAVSPASDKKYFFSSSKKALFDQKKLFSRFSRFFDQ